MANIFRKMIDHLLNVDGVSEVEISAAGPKLKVGKAELAEMKRHPQTVRLMLTECFIWRRALWEDMRAEQPKYVIESLQTVETELKLHEQKLSGSDNLQAIGTAKFVLHWLSAVRQLRKKLEERLLQIDSDKAADPFYDSAGEDRHDAMVECLKELRIRIYPTLKALLAILDEDDETRIEAEGLMDRGLSSLNPAEIRQTDPDMGEAQ